MLHHFSCAWTQRVVKHSFILMHLFNFLEIKQMLPFLKASLIFEILVQQLQLIWVLKVSRPVVHYYSVLLLRLVRFSVEQSLFKIEE